MQPISFKNIDLSQMLDTCIQFRKDAHFVSHGNLNTFSVKETTDWFKKLEMETPDSFLHVYMNNSIIGQLEFKTGLESADGSKEGYGNLFYIIPEFRGKGYGQIIHDYVINRMKVDCCEFAYLRYIPSNKVAENFYLKNHWYPVGESDEKRGQLMRNDF